MAISLSHSNSPTLSSSPARDENAAEPDGDDDAEIDEDDAGEPDEEEEEAELELCEELVSSRVSSQRGCSSCTPHMLLV